MRDFSKSIRVGNKRNYRYRDYIIAFDDDYGIVIYKPDGISVLKRGLTSESEAKSIIDKLGK